MASDPLGEFKTKVFNDGSKMETDVVRAFTSNTLLLDNISDNLITDQSFKARYYTI